MATRTCYQCGKSIPADSAVRMSVQTGVTAGRGGARVHYGKRTLCEECARRQLRRNTIINLTIVAVITGLFIWYVVLGHPGLTS